MTDELATLSAALHDIVPEAITCIQAHSRFPLLLLCDARIEETNEAICEWTSTGLGVLHVANSCTNMGVAIRKACGRVLGLAQHALGLPLGSLDPTDDALARGCSETTGLLRTFVPYLDLVKPSSQGESVDFLPATAQAAVVLLCRALDSGDPDFLRTTLARQASLVLGLGDFKTSYLSDAQNRWPDLGHACRSIQDAATPSLAADLCWRWLHPDTALPPWRTAEGIENPARIVSPCVRIVRAEAEGVVASDVTNSKGFALTYEQLCYQLEFIRRKRLMYFDHERSRPPGIVILEAHLACTDGTHSVHIRVGSLNAEGEARIAAGGGFSVGFTHEGKT